jgi:hypothetical protein
MNSIRTPLASNPATGKAATYRGLIARGLAPHEAANITAVLAGIPIVAQPWTLREVNHLVFLRTLRERGQWGPSERPA